MDLLYAFRYRDDRTGKWVEARYRAELHEIRERFTEFETIGEPEAREPVTRYFNPYRQDGELATRGDDGCDVVQTRRRWRGRCGCVVITFD